MDCKKKFNEFKRLFDWTVVDASEPIAYYVDYKDKGHMLLGYQVQVTYKHHGVREYLFVVDHKFGLVSENMAKKRAERFAKQKQEKMKKQR